MKNALSALLLATLLAFVPQPALATADPWFDNVRAANKTFYPTVPDNYKDFTELRWNTADTAFEACWASVTRADGTVLIDENTVTNWQTQFNYDCESGSGNWVQWNGLNKEGKAVPTGTYTIKVKYYDEYDYAEGSQEENVIHTLARTVNVATGTRWVKERFEYRGSSFDTKRTRGNCRVYRLSGEAALDCWNGRSATVGYDFYVQYDLGIKDFEWWARGEAGCCDEGTITKRGIRDRHDLDIDVTVTKWRSYRVWEVGASWLAKNRI